MNKLFGVMISCGLALPVSAVAQNMPGGAPPQAAPGLDSPPLTFGEIEVSGTAFVGYSSDGYGQEGAILRSDINLKGAYDFHNGITIGFSTDIDLIAKGDNPYAVPVNGPSAYIDDYTIWADFGQYGKLSYTTEGNCVSEDAPWIDGEIYSENNTSIWHLIAPNFRCVGGVAPLLAFPGYAIPADGYFKYEFKYDRFGLEILYDHDLSFTDHISGQTFEGDETATVFGGESPAQAQVILNYRFDFATVSVGANDLDDRFFRLIKFMPQYDLLLIGTREWRKGDEKDPLTVLLADWSPKNLGLFRGAAFEAYLDDSDPQHTESYIGQLKFGTDIWQTGFSVDSEGNWAMEAAYELSPKTRLLLGYDAGLNGSNGKDRFYSGSPDPDLGWRDALDRGPAWEFGLEYTF
ncbi:hypothetical protein [Sagittula sp. MA-2]|uniref:hypothetical protein n=1 Tax=Sagittula sp. MA-2 TaxID=3048007 RepID=UPI0024C3A89E|nr:hypothetical protein [Sagittula sp. MA-2]WHZ38054.1 hypothetical protein QNI11_23820 [Sagittula sp. MA-2]